VSTPLEPRTDGGAHPAPRRPGINCNEAGDLIPALALGPIEPAERLLLLAHCENCPECAGQLERSRETAAYLPFAVQLSSPSEGAKSALFAKIAQSPSVSAPVLSAATAQYSAIIDSPAAKRGPGRDSSRTSIAAEPGANTPSFAWFNSQVAKIGAPLALALVLVGFYAFNPFSGDKNSVDGELPSIVEATLASTNVSNEPTATLDPGALNKIANSSTQDDSSINTAVNLDGFTTQFLSSQPLYALSAKSNGSPTESARSIAPTEGTCRMSSYKEGQYQLLLSGVALPGGAGEAGIYLKAKNGLKTLITKINIDANGNGQTTFSLVQPISDFSMLMIGPIEGGSIAAKPLNGSMTFSLTSTDQLSTFEAATT
jgi:hypothetical protein